MSQTLLKNIVSTTAYTVVIGAAHAASIAVIISAQEKNVRATQAMEKESGKGKRGKQQEVVYTHMWNV